MNFIRQFLFNEKKIPNLQPFADKLTDGYIEKIINFCSSVEKREKDKKLFDKFAYISPISDKKMILYLFIYFGVDSMSLGWYKRRSDKRADICLSWNNMRWESLYYVMTLHDMTRDILLHELTHAVDKYIYHDILNKKYTTYGRSEYNARMVVFLSRLEDAFNAGIIDAGDLSSFIMDNDDGMLELIKNINPQDLHWWEDSRNESYRPLRELRRYIYDIYIA